MCNGGQWGTVCGKDVSNDLAGTVCGKDVSNDLAGTACGLLGFDSKGRWSVIWVV